MVNNKVKSINDFGQSIWLDFFDRKIMDSGALEKFIEEDGISGITSNPALFEKAIVGSSDYDDDIASLTRQGKHKDALFLAIAIKDIQRAADLFDAVHSKNSQEGFVSLEVLPQLAYDTDATIQQARELWKAVGRSNVMIKIPATAAGLPAIRQCTSEGININITLLFGLPRYKEVADAYLSGLEDRVQAGLPIAQIVSVASFFLSRIDVLIDPLLEAKHLPELKGRAAIASARKAYQVYLSVCHSQRFKKLEVQGAGRQRLLWASTGTKDPLYSDVKYIEALIGPETIDTVPLETLEAFKDHGRPANNLEHGIDAATALLYQLGTRGIDLNVLTQQLEDEGIEKFNNAYAQLLKALDQKASAI